MFRTPLATFGLDSDQIDKLELFYRLVTEQNRVMNLTAITDPHEFALKHIIDSLNAWDDSLLHDTGRVADIGTGAGFPAIPIKICRPHLQITLIDSLRKRTDFLKRIVTDLQLDGTQVIHGRAEDLAKQKIFREQFDAVTARAVAPLNVLAEYCLPFAKVGGTFVALKGRAFRTELDDAQTAIKLLGGGQVIIRQSILPNLDDLRAVIYISKVKPTPNKFPRRAGLPNRQPLSTQSKPN